jgi:F-type H+-transporting ATPase subunit b
MVDSITLGRLLLSSGGESDGGLISMHAGTILWTIFIFVILLIVLGKFAWKPIIKALKQREERIRESLEKADKVAADSEKAMAEQKAELEKQRREMTEAMQRTREEAEKSAQELLSKAKQEAADTAEQARRRVEEERKRAVEQIRAEAVDIALQAASHLLERTLDSDDHRKIVDQYLAELPDNLQRH